MYISGLPWQVRSLPGVLQGEPRRLLHRCTPHRGKPHPQLHPNVTPPHLHTLTPPHCCTPHRGKPHPQLHSSITPSHLHTLTPSHPHTSTRLCTALRQVMSHDQEREGDLSLLFTLETSHTDTSTSCPFTYIALSHHNGGDW